MSPGMWFQVDMGSAQMFNEVLLDSRASSQDYPRSYQVLVSNDAATWTQVTAGFGSTTGFTLAEFRTQTARYIRIVQTGSASSWWSIHDFEVFRNP